MGRSESTDLQHPSSKDRLTDWFLRWRTPLRRFLSVRARHCASDLDDIAQEVFLRMLRSDRAKLVTNPQAYLFKMAVNVSTEWSARASRRLPHSDQWLSDLVDDGGPQSEVEREVMETELERAVGSLPARARVILKMHYLEGLTHEAIASRLSITRRVVKRDLIRAYADLREVLTPGPAEDGAVSVRTLSEGAR